MRHIRFILLICILHMFFCPGLGNSNISLSESDPIIPLKGHLFLNEAPLEIDIPKDFHFIEGNDSRFILSQFWGADQETLKDVIGMFIPDTVTSVLSINKAFILSYENLGYVNDSKMDRFSFDKLLTILRANQDNISTNNNWMFKENSH